MDENDVDLDATWDETLRILRRDETVSERVMAFLTLSRLMGVVADTALLAAPSPWAKDVFEQRIPVALREALSETTGRDTRFAVTIDESLLSNGDDDPVPSPSTGSGRPRTAVDNTVESTAPTAPPSALVPVSAGDRAREDDAVTHAASSRADRSAAAPADTAPVLGFPSPSTASPSPAPRRPEPSVSDDGSTLGSDSRLNAKYTFDTFVIGSSNRFAQAAASAVAEAPAKAYNPLFIYGGSGLGKTHLLHAVGHYAQSLYPGIEVRYVNSEEFTNDFINSIQSGQFGKAQEFHRRYRDIDILLIDDIQFLQRAPETMEAFFHTFNTLHNADKQIVITSDLPPKQLGGFEDRMRSRFEMGLMTDVQPPDLETRIAILRKKVQMEGTQEVPRDVLEYIASRISSNIRELEGALIRVQALHSLSRQPMDVSLAESVLKDLLAHDNGAEITAPTIIAQTASYFGLTVDQITGGARTRTLVTARQIAMYLCRKKKISELMKERRAIVNQVTELTARIKNSSSQQG